MQCAELQRGAQPGRNWANLGGGGANLGGVRKHRFEIWVGSSLIVVGHVKELDGHAEFFERRFAATSPDLVLSGTTQSYIKKCNHRPRKIDSCPMRLLGGWGMSCLSRCMKLQVLASETHVYYVIDGVPNSS